MTTGPFSARMSPIYDSQGRYSGFVGVDFDTEYYLAREARFRSIAFASLGVAVLLALAIGYFVARYHATSRDACESFTKAQSTTA